uniref:Reverse transcriptase Ty1/copia-type domain-containing protein n=1 Tax=Fagus sylvatica TaxID=28930 RepID=A0A2N9GF20_FAGSY
MGSTSGHEITHPITVILDGPASYHAWSQNMTVFLKGRRLWRYVTGDIPKPVPRSDTDFGSSDGDSVAAAVVQVDDFEARLEEWESIQCRILSWFINTSVPAISSLLPRLETGQAAWSFLATRYNCTYDFALEFHIEVKLYQMRQESGQSISDYYSQTASMWEQLAAADPPLRYAEDIDLFAKYKDRRRFTQFMMGLREDFEPTRAALLSRSPLPSLDAAVKELISEENRRPHHHLSSSDVVLATPRPPSSSDRSRRFCTYCQKPGHDITECYRKKKDDKRKQHQSRGILPLPQAAAVSSAPVNDPVVTVSQLESMFHRYMSQPSPALSVTPGNKSWLLDSACCNHMTPHASHFSQKTPLVPSPIIYTADSSHMSVSHIGTISSPDLTIPDTYLVPKLSLNLLSVGQLCELGLDLHFSNHGVDVQDPLTGKLLGTGRKTGRLFELCNLQIPSHMVSSSVAATTTLSPDLWHSRLGHASLSRLQLLASQGHLGFFGQIMPKNIMINLSSPFWILMTPFPTIHVPIPLNKMVVPNANFVTFLMLCVPSSYLPLSLSVFGVKRLSLPFTPSIAFPHLLLTRNLPLSYFMTKSQTIPLFEYSVVFVLSLFLPMNETNLNQGLGCVVFLAMVSLKRVFVAMIPYLVAFVSPVMLNFGNIRLFSSRQHFPFISSSMTPIFTDPSIDLYPDPVRDSTQPPSSSDVPSLVLSPAAGSPDSDPASSAPSESPTDIRRSTRVRAPPSHLSDYHCYFALATLHEPHTYREASTNPLWQQAMADELDALHKTHTWDMTTLPPGKSAVGCKWVYKIKTRADGSVERYKARLVARGFTQEYGIDYEETFAPVARLSTPLEFNVKLNPTDGEPLSDATLYRQLVGSLIYLTVTRPDLAYAVHLVSQFMSAPRSTHYAAVLRILRYIKGTLFHGLHFSAQSSLELRAYADADWAGDPTDRRSTTGYCFLLGSSLISWRSKKQSVVARSSTEAEYRALADATSELLWLRWLLADMGAPQTTSTPIHCDNRSAIHIAHNDVFHEHTKHIEIDCYFIRHHLQQSALHLLSVSSEDQLADVFTKSHPPGRLRDLVSKLKMASSSPPCV